MGATEHVEHKEIIQAIPIEIREINSHGKQARVSQRRFRNRSKPPLPVIDPDAIFGGEIIADIYIRRAVAIDIVKHHGQAPVVRRLPEWSSLFILKGSIGEGERRESRTAVIAIQHIGFAVLDNPALVAERESSDQIGLSDGTTFHALNDQLAVDRVSVQA